VIPIAEKFGAEIVLLQVVASFPEIIGQTMPRDSFASPTLQDLSVDAATQQHEAEQASAATYLERQREALAASGLKALTDLREGPAPAAAILAVALDRDCDLIAMSTHGRTGLGRAVMGSVADEVVRNSSMPVLLIRASE
jgi:nucleotide-binding universal stress UspA family protein